jgi:hypothetical protein
MQKRLRRAQASAGGAATVVGLMLVLFLFYLIFIPAETRNELLTGKNASESLIVEETETTNFTFQAYPGRLAFVEEETVEHVIPNLWLSGSKNAEVIESFNQMTVRRGWFVDDKAVLPFTIENLGDISNVALSFSAPVREGLLKVLLNGNAVYEGTPTSANVEPIRLKKDLLKKDNVVEIQVSGVGLRFWGTNEYQLTGIQVIGDVTDWTKQQATNIFTVTEEEYNSLKSSTMSVDPVCVQALTGVLEIFLNDKSVYSAVPDCMSMNKLELYPADFKVGKNTMLFKITEGSYLLDQIKIKNVMKTPKSFIGYFNIDQANYTRIDSGLRKAIANITFVDDELNKQAILNINGRYSYIDQDEPEYTKDISEYIIKGNNYIELRPQTELNVVELTVRIK